MAYSRVRIFFTWYSTVHLLLWMSVELHYHPLMQYILFTGHAYSSTASLSPILALVSATQKNERFFLAHNKNSEVLVSCWSEQQTLEEVSSSSADHENVGPLHLATSSSPESYDWDLTLHSAKAWLTSNVSEQTFSFQWINRKNYNKTYLWTNDFFTVKQFFTSNFGKVKSKCSNLMLQNISTPLILDHWNNITDILLNCLFL